MIKKIIFLSFALMVFGYLLSCMRLTDCKKNQKNSKQYGDMQNFNSIVYPYKASGERVLQIKENCNKLKISMTENNVIELFGKPDIVSPLYNTVKGGKPTGKFYYYLLSQDKKEGSQKEKNQVSITVYFSLQGKLTHAFGVNTPFFKNIEKDN